MIVTTKQLFAHAYGQYAVGAYNINNLEQTVGLFRGNLGKSKSNEEPSNSARAPRSSCKSPAAPASIPTSGSSKRSSAPPTRSFPSRFSRSISITAPNRSATTASPAVFIVR